MALEFVWTKRADRKSEKIIQYLLQEWDEKVTASFVKRVYEFLDILKEFPEIGTIENREKGIRGFVIVKQVSIFYRIKGNKIIILNFFDNRQNPISKPI